MATSGNDSQAFNDEVNDAKSLGTTMTNLESRFQKHIEDAWLDLQQSFHQTTSQIQSQFNEIQRNLKLRWKEVHQEISPTPFEQSLNSSLKLQRIYSSH